MVTITTKYFGPTNSRGSRIRVTAGNGWETKFYSYDYAGEAHMSALKLYCADMAKKYPDSFFNDKNLSFTIGDTDVGIVAVFTNDKKLVVNISGGQ